MVVRSSNLRLMPSFPFEGSIPDDYIESKNSNIILVPDYPPRVIDFRFLSMNDDEEVANLTIAEGRQTLENQLSAQNDIDNKAARILRINTVLLGIVLSGISFLVNNNVVRENGTVFNFYMTGGLVLILGSTAFAAITYSASDSYVGISKEDIDELINGDFSSVGSKEGLAEVYGEWIEFNSETIVIDAFYFTITENLLVWGLSILALGVADAINHEIRLVTVVAVVSALSIFTYTTGLYGQLQKWWGVVIY